MRTIVLLGVAALALAAPARADEAKPKKPSLNLRASPRMAFSPANILLTAELVGGDDVEEFYCPEVLWEWDDGGKSVEAPDCDPFEPGKTKIERRFTAQHLFDHSGNYTVRVTLRRNEKPIATQTVQVTVRPGLGDRSDIPNGGV